MVLEKKDVDAVLSVEDGAGFKAVQSQLQRLVESSMSGQRMFGSSWKMLAAELVKSEVASAKKELLGLAKVTFDALSNIKLAADERISLISTLHLLPPRRQVDIEYRKQMLPMVVRSAAEFVEVQLQATLRCLATSCGDLEPLSCETVGDEAAGQKAFIQDDLVQHARNARRFFGNILSVQEKIDGDTVLVTLFSLCLFAGGVELKGDISWNQFLGENSRKRPLGQNLFF